MSIQFTGYGHPLDDRLLPLFWQEVAIKNYRELALGRITINLNSSLAAGAHAGRSRLSFEIGEKLLQDVIGFFNRQPNFNIAYHVKRNSLISFDVTIRGHILEMRVMDDLFRKLSSFDVDLEDVLITYPSSLFCRDKGMPSTARFRLITTQTSADKVRALFLSTFSNNHHSLQLPVTPTCFILDNSRVQRERLSIWGHVLDHNLLTSLAASVLDEITDLQDVVIKYPSSKIGLGSNEPSILYLTLVTDKDQTTNKLITLQQRCMDVGCRVLVAIPVSLDSRIRFQLSGCGRVEEILDYLRMSIIGSAVASCNYGDIELRNMDLIDIQVCFPSFTEFKNNTQQFELEFTIDFNKEKCGTFPVDLVQNAASRYDLDWHIIPLN